MEESSLPLSTSDKNQNVMIRFGPGQASIEAKTLVQHFDEVVEKYGDRVSLSQKIIAPGESAADTKWTSWTWKEYRANADAFAKSLLSIDIDFKPRDCINIIGFNSPEWFFANFGAILAGGIASGIYATNEPEACKYVSQHSEAKVVVCEGVKQLEKYYGIASDLPELKALVIYGPDSVPEDIKDKLEVPVYSFSDFLKLGESVADSELKLRSEEMEPGQVCTLIYTSGTTGPPKAVMITHDNISWTARTAFTTMKKPIDCDDHIISYLPLSHIAAQIIDMHTHMLSGCQVWFAQPDALRGSLGATLKEVKPTFFFGVPRVWEKIYDKMQEVAKSTHGLKKKVSGFAKSKASEYWNNHQYGGNQKSPFMYGIAAKLLGKVKEALGFERCNVFYVSAAPIDVKILKYFASVNIPILEVFGQSECTGPHTTNAWNAWKIGSVGRPMIGTITKIDPENGELIYSGRHIFAGYMGMEDKTKETIDPDGFLHSGDVVKIDDCHQEGMEEPSGFVNITGRIKELIITAGGENIAPVLIEEQMKNAMPALSNCMVIGDRLKFLSILLCLQVEMNEDGSPTNKLTGEALDTSKSIGSSATTTIEAQTCDKWKAYFDEGVASANEKAISRASKIAKWALLETDFTEKGGELTPTLKLKRSVASEIHAKSFESMYK